MPVHIPLFLLTVALVVLMPGASNVTIVRQTLAGGRAAGWRTVAGTSTGIVIWSAAAAVGVSALLLTNPLLYSLFRLVGGLVLVLLGGRTLVNLVRGRAQPGGEAGRGIEPSPAPVAVGLASVLLNPNTGLFAMSLLPQFVTRTGPVLLSTIGLGVIWAAMSGSWNSAWVFALDRIRTTFTRPALRRRLECATGVVLMLVGAALALSA
jgi:threonine/homoserine/homoserine lactone efflux protein